MRELDGRLAVITGGGKGIGRAIALAYASDGARVAVLGRDQAALAAVCEHISAADGSATALICDLSDAAAIQHCFARIQADLGPIDILVNNAGITASGKFTALDLATWEQIMRINATGPFLCSQAVVPDMIRAGTGSIINIASIAALHGIMYAAAYSASKHALLGLTRALALELARHQISVNAICPGWIETEMLHGAIASIVARTGRSPEQARADILAQAGQPRVASVEEVAALALTLARPGSRHMTGQSIPIPDILPPGRPPGGSA